MESALRSGEPATAARSIILDADAMGRLRKELIWTLGAQRARAVLTRFGYAMGYGEAVRCRDLCEDDEIWLGKALEALAANRLAQISRSEVRFDRAAGTFSYTAEIVDSFEVIEHSSHPGTGSTTEACWILTGFLSGFASAFLGDEVYFKEVHCAINGGDSCRVLGLTSEQWDPVEAGALASLFEEENIGNELTIVYDELTNKNEELEQAIAMLKAQQEATPDGVLIVDLDGRVLSFNTRFLKIWGIPEELAARRDDSAMLNLVQDRLKDPQGFLALVRHLYTHPHESRQDDIVEFKDGTIVQRATVPVVHRDGQPMARAWYFRDITTQRKLEAEYRQSQKMEAVGTLAGGIAHDFNNLLTAIGGHISLVARNLEPSSAERASLQIASRAVERASDLTRALLNFSRQSPVERRPLDLRDLISETLKLLRRTFDPRIEIEASVEAGLWPVLADPGQIQQVITNVCVNARDAMPQGGRLLIEASNVTLPAGRGPRGTSASGDYVALKLSDTGSGMSPEVQARIFDPFFTTKEIGKGTGLGLAMVYGILQQHGASIRCESSPGKGTIFSILLPRTLAQRAQETAVAEETPRGGHETILLVDDEEAIRNLGRQIMEEYGYHVLVACDGEAGVEVYRQNAASIRLVVLDLLMPRRSGREAFFEIRRISSAVPVLICTGYSAAGHLEDLLAMGPTVSLGKPFKPDDLVRSVRQMLDGQTAPARRGESAVQ